MKLSIIAMVLFIGFGSALADEKEARRQVCSKYAEKSVWIMEARQNGASAIDVMAAFKGGDPDIYSLHLATIEAAYSVPVYKTEDNKIRAIEEFQNKQFLNCLTLK